MLRNPEDMKLLKRRSKYRNIKVKVDGIIFDSKKEAERWKMLQFLESQGKIRDLKRQVRYTLMVYGKKICSYVADFVYEDRSVDGRVVEDVKSDHTRRLPVYRIKKKLMKALYDIDIKEI